MIIKTRGIVLKYIRYRETSIIVNIYTESLGLQGYIVNSVRSARSKGSRIAVYQPLTLLDLVVYFREKKQLQRISEVKCAHPFNSIPINPKKSAIALFIMEILGKTLKEQTGNAPLFNFLWESVLYFDHAIEGIGNFHLVFLVKLSDYLGFGTQAAREIEDQIRQIPNAPVLSREESDLLRKLLNSKYSSAPSLTHPQRQNLLQALLHFYQWHVERFAPIKSLPVLNQVFTP